MRRAAIVTLLLTGSLSACDNDVLVPVAGGTPEAPRALAVRYYAGAVTVEWELAPGWDGEAFRVYSRRTSDANYYMIAEVTSCSGGLCSYEDWNVSPGQTYLYYVSAVDPDSGIETASASTVQVFVPTPTPPPVPDAPYVIALDDANFFTWGNAARTAADFAFYRVYQQAGATSYLLGETDSEGFLDLLAANGTTYTYFVTSVDDDGHESGGSASASGTPRPDFTGEWVYDFFAKPTTSGFRFVTNEATNPIRSGTAASRHFRLETYVNGWWLVPGPGTSIHQTGFATTALKCGVAADAGCADVSVAPTSGYSTADMQLDPQTTYVLRVIGDDGLAHYGAIRVVLLGYDQSNDPIMIFDWAYQLQPGNPALVVAPGE
ncbi:MAG: hypothetical protein FJ207_14920 [Gemmatimonadetes bacterium]|nr:hypothetical protein [Gemmatimonadota bacterium]